MANIRKINEIIQNLIDFYKVQQPDLDTKPGEVARDLFIDGPSSAISLLYDELGQLSSMQSIKSAVGSELDKILKNYGITRKPPTKSSGIGILTFNSINSSIPITKSSSIYSSNGIAFNVVSPFTITSNQSNYYKSIASKYKNDLDFLGIQDQYAVEVTLESSIAGLNSNIAKYGLSKTTISGINNVINVQPFSGGSNQEDDTTFRNRGISTFGGTATGTEIGYKNLALAQSNVLDAVVITPGDPLMTRDGTVVTKNLDNTYTIISEGSGGKVDIITLGKNLLETSYSYIYTDKSNTNDPTNSKNNIVLGLSESDLLKTVNKRRYDALKNNTGIPQQPINSIVQVSGSTSGSNFIEKSIDSLGRVTGNYELVKDTSIYSGSPWGFDTFAWIDNKVTFTEDKIKGKFCGQDNVNFTDLLNVSDVTQNIYVTNENSNILSDKSTLQLLHYPCTNVTRVFNTNTGERYVITNQNPDGSGSINNTGRITISGNTLPSVSDVLQVDYTWIKDYDCYSDFDGRYINNNSRSVTDSIDWGLSNLIKSENVTLTLNTQSTSYTGKTTHQINSILKVNTFKKYTSKVELLTSGLYSGRLAVNLNTLVDNITSISSGYLAYSNKEVYSTDANDGTFISTRVVVGPNIRYNVSIILPTDTIAVIDDYVTFIVNESDVYNVNNTTGTFNNTTISIPASNISTNLNYFDVKVYYICNISDLLSTTVSSLSVSRRGNNYYSSSGGFLNNYVQNNYIKENVTLSQSGSNYYFDLNLSVSDNILNQSDILTVIRISDGLELYNELNLGTISTPGTNYRITLSGYNTPVLNDKCLVIYKSESIKKSQPGTFYNKIINYSIHSLNYDVTDGYYIPLQNFSIQSGVNFEVLDGYGSSTSYTSGTDGYLELNYSHPNEADFSSLSVNFSLINEISYKTLKITNGTGSNTGTFDIVGYNSANNKLHIKPIYEHLSNSNIFIVRLKDNREIFNDSCSINYSTNRIIFNNTNNLLFGDKVLLCYLQHKPLKQTSTKLLVNLLSQITNPGSLNISGYTLNKTTQVFSCTNNGSIQNVSEALKKALNKNSDYTIPSKYKLARIVKLEKVEVVGEEVISVLKQYNITQSKIKNVYVYSNHIEDTSLSDLEFKITDNDLSVGDNLRITFYYYNINDNDILYFTRNATYYSSKDFIFINKIYINSGFINSDSVRFTFSFMNQPSTNSRYKASYTYTAPKQNERIFIKYNYNKLISDVTQAVENNRPVSADVIVKEAKEILVDIQMNIVISSNTSISSETIKQNVLNKITSALTSSQLGTTIDASDLIIVAYSVTGVDRARIIYFNRYGESGQKLSLIANKNEYFSPNNVSVVIESR